MEYQQLRTELLQYLNVLQRKGFSYQSICDYINAQQRQFVLYKDFFSRFQSKPHYFKGAAKLEKLSLIHFHLLNFYELNIDEGDFLFEHLENIISKAANVRFESYLGINRPLKFTPVELLEFYHLGGPAYLSIDRNLKHKQQYGWELDALKHGSTFKILSFESNNLFTQAAVVTTKEFWKLSWVNANSKQLQIKFESLGEQTYLLTKDKEGNWKIFENMPKARTNKIEPEYVDHSTLSAIYTENREENKITAVNFLANNELMHCIEFIKIAYADKLLKNQEAILNRIRESYLNSHRLLNTNVINYAVDMLRDKSLIISCHGKKVCSSKGLRRPLLPGL